MSKLLDTKTAIRITPTQVEGTYFLVVLEKTRGGVWKQKPGTDPRPVYLDQDTTVRELMEPES